MFLMSASSLHSLYTHTHSPSSQIEKAFKLIQWNPQQQVLLIFSKPLEKSKCFNQQSFRLKKQRTIQNKPNIRSTSNEKRIKTRTLPPESHFSFERFSSMSVSSLHSLFSFRGRRQRRSLSDNYFNYSTILLFY